MEASALSVAYQVWIESNPGVFARLGSSCSSDGDGGGGLTVALVGCTVSESLRIAVGVRRASGRPLKLALVRPLGVADDPYGFCFSSKGGGQREQDLDQAGMHLVRELGRAGVTDASVSVADADFFAEEDALAGEGGRPWDLCWFGPLAFGAMESGEAATTDAGARARIVRAALRRTSGHVGLCARERMPWQEGLLVSAAAEESDSADALRAALLQPEEGQGPAPVRVAAFPLGAELELTERVLAGAERFVAITGAEHGGAAEGAAGVLATLAAGGGQRAAAIVPVETSALESNLPSAAATQAAIVAASTTAAAAATAAAATAAAATAAVAAAAAATTSQTAAPEGKAGVGGSQAGAGRPWASVLPERGTLLVVSAGGGGDELDVQVAAAQPFAAAACSLQTSAAGAAGGVSSESKQEGASASADVGSPQDNAAWWPHGHDGEFVNVGLKTWQAQRGEWQAAVGDPQPSSTAPINYEEVSGALASMRRTYELPHPMALAELIDLYLDLWESCDNY